jgi:hypothetical protein
VQLPVQSLPWRDLRLLEKYGRRWSPFGCDQGLDPLVGVKVQLKGADQVLQHTDIRGAEGLELAEGIATVRGSGKTAIVVPCLRVAEGARMPGAVRVAGRRPERARLVHVAQLSGGIRVGGVTLEFRSRRREERRA